MGTRSTLTIKDDKGNILLHMYRQFDGYPSGMGKDIVEFISKGKLVDGYPIGSKFGEVFNGMGELACQLITHFKESYRDVIFDKNGKAKVVKRKTVGNFYIISKKEFQKEGFHYELSCKGDQLILKMDGDIEDGDDYKEVKNYVLFPLTDESKKILELKDKKKKQKKV
jgi:hypothetical protein